MDSEQFREAARNAVDENAIGNVLGDLAKRRQFNARTADVPTRSEHSGHRHPCVNIKVRRGLEVITPEQWAELRGMTDTPDVVAAKFTREWCEDYLERRDSCGNWHNDACEQGMETIREEALALFGASVTIEQTGRSGGWLIARGLPDVETWGGYKEGQECPHCDNALTADATDMPECEHCGRTIASDLPSLKGSRVEGARFLDGTIIADDANLFERWAFFEEVCRAECDGVPYTVASLLALNCFKNEEGTRPVEFLRAYPYGTWELFTLDCPARLTGEAAVGFAVEHLPADPHLRTTALVAVYADPGL